MRAAPFACLLTVLLCASTAHAETSWKGGGGFGLGAGFFGNDGDTQQVGVGLSAEAYMKHRSGLTLRFVGDLTLTDFERTLRWAEAGRKVGEWSVNGFKDVTSWIGRGTEDDTILLRALGGFFAYTFLTLTLMTAGILYLVSPFGSFTALDTAAAAGYTLDLGTLSLYVEGGFGHVFYFHPEDDRMYSGWGPIAGTGLEFDGFGVGIRGMWSPKALHASDDENIFAATATFKIVK